MTSPIMETFCCAMSVDQPSVQSTMHFNVVPYNWVCIISSTIGILGALYQILPTNASNYSMRSLLSSNRHQRIIMWLAIADLFASVGILTRSIAWLSQKAVEAPFPPDNHGNVFCAVISGIIHYFYTCTFMWTCCYAYDVYITAKQKSWSPTVYHIVSWGIPIITTTSGLISLYAPDMRCHTGYLHVIINVLMTFIPMLLVMIVNPVLYYLASREVRTLFTSYMGQFSDQDRQFMKNIREKMFFIVLVFYCCWIPNIINSIVIWARWGNLPRTFIIMMWYIMAVLNPLQALLNSVVYRGWNICGKAVLNILWGPPIMASVPADDFVDSEIRRPQTEETNQLLSPT